MAGGGVGDTNDNGDLDDDDDGDADDDGDTSLFSVIQNIDS